jgi:hypothetical protein
MRLTPAVEQGLVSLAPTTAIMLIASLWIAWCEEAETATEGLLPINQ